MNSTLLLAAIIIGAAFVGAWALRLTSDGVRVAFDFGLFCIASLFLTLRHISPLLVSADGTLQIEEDLLPRAVVGLWWLLGARLLVGLLRITLHRDRHSREARLFSDLTAGAIYLITAFVILNTVLALPVRGVLATSGILAVVLGLALQNTLADVFSGIAVGIEAPFRVDDRIMINDKLEGKVIQVNWRSIRILTDSHDVAIFPNSLVAKAEIINRSFPNTRRTGSVNIACTRSASPESVSEALMQATLLCPSVDRDPLPSVALVEMKRRKSVYRVGFWAANSDALSAAQDQLIRRCRQQLNFLGMLPGSQQPPSKEPHWTIAPPLTDMAILGSRILFESLSAVELTRLADGLKDQHLKPQEILFSEGAVDGTLYIVASGVLEISRKTPAGGQEVIGHIGAGEYIGELGLFLGSPHAATATACVRSRVLLLAKEAVDPLLKENPALARAFERSVRRGSEILHQSALNHDASSSQTTAEFLDRILVFFKLKHV